MKSPEQRVAKGARFLDRYDPNWPEKIDRDRLNIANATDCIWGQLTGGYSKRPKFRLMLREYRLGFTPDDFDGWFWSVGPLNAAWIDAINERRARVRLAA